MIHSIDVATRIVLREISSRFVKISTFFKVMYLGREQVEKKEIFKWNYFIGNMVFIVRETLRDLLHFVKLCS